MRQVLFFVVVLVFGAVLVEAGDMAAPDGAALWKKISMECPYTNWGQFPDHMGMQDGVAPHGPLHIVYVNKEGLAKGHPKPDGAIIVKENYMPDKKLAAVTVMYKVNGYNPAAGDWFWAKYAPDGTVQAEGKPKGCVGCHSGRADMDFIMVSDH